MFKSKKQKKGSMLVIYQLPKEDLYLRFSEAKKVKIKKNEN